MAKGRRLRTMQGILPGDPPDRKSPSYDGFASDYASMSELLASKREMIIMEYGSLIEYRMKTGFTGLSDNEYKRLLKQSEEDGNDAFEDDNL